VARLVLWLEIKVSTFLPSFRCGRFIFSILIMSSGQSISTAFREHLEDLQAGGRPTAITFRAESGALSTILARITSIYCEEGQVHLRTDNGLSIAVDRVEEAGGMRRQHWT
ncbi:MAG TPA: hypothetical protein VGE66_20370, partial [Chitinophagaceae bacterium]